MKCTTYMQYEQSLATTLVVFRKPNGRFPVNGKPAPEIYLTAASTLGVLSERCMALEDSPIGVKAAVAAGLYTIQIPDLVQPDAELLPLKHTVLDSLDNVATMVTTGELF